MGRSAGLDRAQVVAAGAELADRHGLAALTLAQVAAALGVRLPSLYNHVEGLPGLRRELALLAGRELEARLSRAALGKAGDAAMLALAEAYRAYVLEHPGRYAAIIRAPAPDDQDLQAVAQAIIAVLLAVLEPYELGEVDALHAVRGLRAIAHGFATLEAGGGFGLPLDRDESYRRLVRAFLVGLVGR
jgi:AcrR family transcriptional regulator